MDYLKRDRHFDLYFWDINDRRIVYRIRLLTETEVNNCLEYISDHYTGYNYAITISGHIPWSDPVMLVDKSLEWRIKKKSMTVFDINDAD